MQLFDGARRPLTLDVELARGGEATVYRVQGRGDLVAKLYGKPRAGYDDKLEWMRANPPSDPNRGTGHASIAWPADVIRDGQGRFVGFTMPFVQGAVPLLDVLSPRRRALVLPGFDRRYLHRTARNLALAIAALHARDYVVGDLNQSNVLVTPTALVTLIDTDSFQVREHRPAQILYYPCPVGKPEYTPPELQGQPFTGLVRLPEHDRFGLAVLVFQLLMQGSHPFRGRWRVAGDPPTLETKIARGLYPYAVPAPAEVAPPPETAGLETLYPPLAELFDLAFRSGHDNPRRRPAPEDWARTLAEAEAALVTCRNGHIHADHLKTCPVCGTRHARPVNRPVGRAAATRPAAGPAPAPSPGAGAPVPAQVTPAGTAVARRAPMMPTLGALALAPWRALARTTDDAVTGLARAVRVTAKATAVFGLQRVLVQARVIPAGQTRLVPPRLAGIARRTVGLALVGGLAGAAAAFLLSGAWLLVGAVPLAAAGVRYGGVAALAGGTALALTAWFRALGDRMDGQLSRRELGQAVGRAVAAATGWSLAWLLAGLLLAVLPGWSLPDTVLGAAGATGHLDLAAWMVGWVLFGAAGGALGAPAAAPRGRWLFVGLVFGLLGWLAALVAGQLVP